MAARERVQLPKPRSSRARLRRDNGDAPDANDQGCESAVAEARDVLAAAERFLAASAQAA